MPVLFDPKQGTDIVTSGAVVNTPSEWSAYFWARRPSGTHGQFFSLGTGALIDVYISSGTTDRLNIDRVTDGTSSSHAVVAADDGITYNNTDYVFFGISQSGRSTPVVRTASPGQSVALASRTVTVLNAGTGTAATTANQIMHIGNWQGLDYALGGDLAFFGFHNVILSEAEFSDAMALKTVQRGRVFSTDLTDSSTLVETTNNGYALTGSGIADSSASPPLPTFTPSVRPIGDFPLMSSWMRYTSQLDGLTPNEQPIWEWWYFEEAVSVDIDFNAPVSTLTFSMATALTESEIGVLVSTLTLSQAAAAAAASMQAANNTVTLSMPTTSLSMAITAAVASLTLSQGTATPQSSQTAANNSITLSQGALSGLATQHQAANNTLTLNQGDPSVTSLQQVTAAVNSLLMSAADVTTEVELESALATLTLGQADVTVDLGTFSVQAANNTLTLSMGNHEVVVESSGDGNNNWYVLTRRRRLP